MAVEHPLQGAVLHLHSLPWCFFPILAASLTLFASFLTEASPWKPLSLLILSRSKQNHRVIFFYLFYFFSFLEVGRGRFRAEEPMTYH